MQPIRPRLRPDRADPTLLFPEPEPRIGSGALLVGRDLYAFACECAEYKCPCVLGRAPLSRALSREAWSFHAADGQWRKDYREAVAVMDAAPVVSVHWNRHLGQYLAVYSTPVPGRALSIRTAPRPEGPWSEAREFFECLPPARSEAWNYAGIVHPEFSWEEGRVDYLTYYRPTGFFKGEFRHVELRFR